MDWYIIFIIIIGSLLVLMAAGLPIVFAFWVVNIVSIYFLWGGSAGLEMFILSIRDSVTTFAMLPIPLFLIMGDVLFLGGLVSSMMDAVDKWLGRLPGRLSILTVAGGALFGALSGSNLATVATLSTLLLPEMEKRGYKKPMSLGPILASGGIDVMIPPSALGVLLASIAEVSVAGVLIGSIIPGLLMASLFTIYILLRCWLEPSLAPAYEVAHVSLSEKIIALGRHILPLGFIIFLVTGVIFFGLCTPTEAAATGALGCFILAAIYRKLNWQVIKKSVTGTLRVTVMLLMIITGAEAFSRILGYTGATKGLVELSVNLPVSPIVMIILMQVVVLIMGCFMEVTSIMMIVLPVFMPIIRTLSFDPVWFAVIMLLNIGMASVTPPFGLSLFLMKSLSPGSTMVEIWRSVIFFIICDIIAMALMIAFPAIVLWLPNLMH